MAFGHGKSAVFKLDDSGGSLTDISAYVRSVSPKRSADTADVTCFGAAVKSYIAGLTDMTISVEGVFDPTADAILHAALGAIKTWEFGPQGSGGGSIKYTAEGFVTSYTCGDASVDGAVTWSAEIQVTGTLTRTTY